MSKKTFLTSTLAKNVFIAIISFTTLIFRSLSVHRFQKITFNKDYQKGLQGLLVNYHLTFPVIKRQIIWIL